MIEKLKLAIPRLNIKELKDNKRKIFTVLSAFLISLLVFGALLLPDGIIPVGRDFMAGVLVQPTEEKEEVQEIQEVVQVDYKYIEIAQRGDGLTHVARRVLERHLNEEEMKLSVEQRIYVEDHIQKQLGSAPLELGQEVTISQDLVVEAIDLSLELTLQQLENLEQYSLLVSF